MLSTYFDRFDQKSASIIHFLIIWQDEYMQVLQNALSNYMRVSFVQNYIFEWSMQPNQLGIYLKEMNFGTVIRRI